MKPFQSLSFPVVNRMLLLVPAAIGMAVIALGQENPNPATGPGVGQSPTVEDGSEPYVIAEHSVGGLTLPPGKLIDVVEALRGIYMRSEGAGSGDVQLPTLVYGPGTADLVLPAPLRLVDARGVDALALIAVATGCILDPIHAPAQDGEEDYGPPRIIGYRFAMPAVPGTSAGGMFGGSTYSSGGYSSRNSLSNAEPLLTELSRELAALRRTRGDYHPDVVHVRERMRQEAMEDGDTSPWAGVGINLAQREGRIVAAEVVHGSPAERSRSIEPGDAILSVAQGDGEPVEISGMDMEEVVALIRGEPGSRVRLRLQPAEGGTNDEAEIVLVREKLLVPEPPPDINIDPVPKVNMLIADELLLYTNPPASGPASESNTTLMVTGGENELAAPDRGAQQVTRIYALGFALGGADESEALQAQRVNEVEELISVALAKADPDGGGRPDISFHLGSRALIARATLLEHDIIDQVIKVIKEIDSMRATETANPMKEK